MNLWLIAALRKSGREPTQRQWRVAMWLLVLAGLLVLVTVIVAMVQA